MIEEIKYVNQIETEWGTQSTIPYVSIKEAARLKGVNAEEVIAFVKKHDLRTFKFRDDFLFMIPWHFDSVLESMEQVKRNAEKCSVCGRFPSNPGEE